MNEPSLRERNKQEKLQRIKTSAKQLFEDEGFDATTTRKIAKRAEVGLATLFLYASDKRDLLFLVCNDGLYKLSDDAFADVPLGASLIDQLTIVFRHFFIHHAQNKRLSRDLLRELTFYDDGMNSERFHQVRRQNINRIQQMIADAKKSGAINTDSSEDTIARMIFYILASELRRWLSIDGTTPEAGVQELRSMMLILIEGLNPSY
ncbi:MAG: TetR/AcrR family transcriptional regulator [Pseudomonadales bacterium]|nr:TetR/AcrR family transcriptional regulator [Pseudomonadales bacterium]